MMIARSEILSLAVVIGILMLRTLMLMWLLLFVCILAITVALLGIVPMYASVFVGCRMKGGSRSDCGLAIIRIGWWS